MKKIIVSIPLKSGHIVIENIWDSGQGINDGFNPLKIGSYCNKIVRKAILMQNKSFNPLKIGSYCNTDSGYIDDMLVSFQSP